MQNNILSILEHNSLIPVVTVHSIDELENIFDQLTAQQVYCIEITLRTNVAWEAIRIAKEKYGDRFKIGVGTITAAEAIEKCVAHQVDFMVSPGLSPGLIEPFVKSGIPFLPGVSTPSEIIFGMELGWQYFKFFPANLFGGINALKTYGAIFPTVTFCPTGGINGDNYKDYLNLPNVKAIGGSWLVK